MLLYFESKILFSRCRTFHRMSWIQQEIVPKHLESLGKTLLGDVNKLFVFKCLLTMPSNFLPPHHKQTFPAMIWIFNYGEGDGIESRLPFKTFSTWLTHSLA